MGAFCFGIYLGYSSTASGPPSLTREGKGGEDKSSKKQLKNFKKALKNR